MARIVRSVHAWGGEKLSYFEVTPDAGATERERVVLMHGGGPGDSKEPSLALAEDFAALGFHVLGLDFMGSGQSSGTWSGMTLNRRQDQAASLIDAHVPASSPLILIGFSMGGQTATDLVGRFGDRVQRIALFAPGVYGSTIRDTRFGDDTFTDLVFNRPELWPDSPALEVMATFHGQTLLILPGHDEAVPPGMAGLIERSVRSNPRSSTLVIDGAGHLLDHWLAEHPEDRKSVIGGLTRDRRP
ncbi:alpha/beta hydrolase [Streptomyces sp. NBC_01197]|uniref:alpha/beta hydrolase n=1 Tax=Streptomyces sp. NBC_01197 TaxID=2903768 RepID=UPI002E13D989|nr:alpha/beta hydrolase [Streptomyces sp. NBC_01197]